MSSRLKEKATVKLCLFVQQQSVQLFPAYLFHENGVKKGATQHHHVFRHQKRDLQDSNLRGETPST